MSPVGPSEPHAADAGPSRCAGLPVELVDALFGNRRASPARVLQLGVRTGAATEAWSRYFAHPDTRVLGLDLKLDEAYLGLDDAKIRLCTINVTDCDLPRALAMDTRLEAWRAPYDVIVDDASGDWREQTISLLTLHRLLRLRGTYVVSRVQRDMLPVLRDVATACGLEVRRYEEDVLVATLS